MFLEFIDVIPNFKAQYKGRGFQNIGFVLLPKGTQDQGNLCGNIANMPVQQPRQENELMMHETILRNFQEQFQLQEMKLERMRKECLFTSSPRNPLSYLTYLEMNFLNIYW